MATRRKSDDPESRSRFRTERVVCDNGRWYFLTREGTAEGPFSCRADALQRLEVYLRLAQSGMLSEGAALSLAD